MVMYWVVLLVISILLYVLLDGFDLGVGMLFGLAHGEAKRSAMYCDSVSSASARDFTGSETSLSMRNRSSKRITRSCTLSE